VCYVVSTAATAAAAAAAATAAADAVKVLPHFRITFNSDIIYSHGRSALPPPRGAAAPQEIQWHPEVGKAASKQLSTYLQA
jgi:hypothetical protein